MEFAFEFGFENLSSFVLQILSFRCFKLVCVRVVFPVVMQLRHPAIINCIIGVAPATAALGIQSFGLLASGSVAFTVASSPCCVSARARGLDPGYGKCVRLEP